MDGFETAFYVDQVVNPPFFKDGCGNDGPIAPSTMQIEWGSFGKIRQVFIDEI